MSLERRVHFASVENNPLDLRDIKSTYRGMRRRLGKRYNVGLSEEIPAFDNAKDALEHLCLRSIDCEPVDIMLIDRDLEYSEEVFHQVEIKLWGEKVTQDDIDSQYTAPPNLLGPASEIDLINLTERDDPDKKRDGVDLLNMYHIRTRLSPIKYSPLDIAVFYTAEEDIVRDHLTTKYKETLLPAMADGSGPIILIQSKGDDENNELANVYEASLLIHNLVTFGPDGKKLSDSDALDKKREIATYVTSVNHSPSKFLELYGN